MKEYLKAQSKTNEAVLGNGFNADELERFSKSDYRWAENRNKQFRQRIVKKGEIYQFEFGKNFIPEMSYEHRGLIIGVKQKLLYVLPIFSYDSTKYPDVFHPIDSPNSKSEMLLLKSSEFVFINHDSVLKLNDIRTVSVNRILYQHSGRIDPASKTYMLIESLCLRKYFPVFYHEYEKNTKIIEELNQKVSMLAEEKEKQETTIRNLCATIEALKKDATCSS